jgi:hypothetical protein
MTEEIVKASEVEVAPDLVDDEKIERSKSRKAVTKRLARREALKRAGGDVQTTTSLAGDLAGDLDERMRKRDRAQTTAFKAQKAAEAAVAAKRAER